MKLNKKKSSIIIIVIILFIIIGCLFIKRDKTLLCELNTTSEINDINIKININKNLNKYNINYTYNFKEGYMDNLVDKYDNMKKYLDYINKNNGIITDISQDGYTLKYKIDIEIDKVNKKDYKILELDEVTKLDSIKEIKKHYEDLGYTCK